MKVDASSAANTPETETCADPKVGLFSKILVPIDFSEPSDEALGYALFLARASGAGIHLLNVVEPIPTYSGFQEMPIVFSETQTAERCREELAKVADKYRSADLSVTSEVTLGPAADGIAAKAGTWPADLIVIATHGYTGLKHVLLGSVAEKIVRYAPCPVLVIRRKEEKTKGGVETGGHETPFSVPIQLLVPTDFSPRSVYALRYAARFARQIGGQITLVHCVNITPGDAPILQAEYDLSVLTEVCADAARRELSQQAASECHAAILRDSVILYGAPLAKLPEFARKGHFDLIICATRGYTGLKHLLLGSTAEGIVRHAPCPVLVVGEKSHAHA